MWGEKWRKRKDEVAKSGGRSTREKACRGVAEKRRKMPRGRAKVDWNW